MNKSLTLLAESVSKLLLLIFLTIPLFASSSLIPPPNCSQTFSSNLSVNIPSNSTSTINSVISVPLGFNVVDVNIVNLNVSHTYINDLEVILISPNGTQVKVIDNICGSHNNILCNLDDETNTNLPCPPTGNNTYRPSNLLSAFDGQNMNGDWTLRIIDNYSSDGGSLNGWGLEFTFECAEICNDGIDNDGDGNIDCADNDCNTGLNLSRWLGIPGSSISNMTNHANYPNSPNETAIITSFKGPINYADNYGTRVIGYIKPSITGNYTFNFTSDDDGQLYLSTDANPANKSLIASQVGWSNIDGHNSFPSQTSSTISLVAGQHYYVEFLQKESGGGDHFHVYWKTPSNSTWQIIPGTNLVPTTCYEICNDGIDNDGDGMIDCADTDSDCYPISLTPRYNIDNQTWTNGNSITACAGTDLKLGVQIGVQSSIKLTYPNNTIDNSSDGDSFFNINTNTATSGNYKITYTNSEGCSSEAVFTVNISNVSISNVTSTNPSNCPTLNNGSIVINATGSNLQYSIDNGANYYNTNTFSNLSAGSYQIKVKDSSSQCEESYSSNVTLTDPSCADPCTDSDGDGNIDCNDTGCMPVINNVAIVSPTDCPQANNGSITITATGLNLLYSINGTNYQSNNIFNGLSAGSYNIHVRNTISNCTAVYSSNPAVLTAPDCSEICNNNYDDDGDGLTDCLDPDCGAPNIISVTSTNNSDCSTANGSISITATGNNLRYSITGAAPYSSSSMFTGLAAGNYNVQVINTQTNCVTNYNTITLTGPSCTEICNNNIDDDGDGLTDCIDPDCSQLVISAINKADPNNCPDKNNGSISITATGNNLQYSINNGSNFQNSSVFTNLTAGTYQISIRNSVSGCTLNATSSTVLTDPNCNPSNCGTVNYTDCEGNSGSGNLTSTYTYILKAGSISDRPFCIGDVSPNCNIVNKRVAYCLEYGVNEGNQNDRFVRTSYNDPNIRWGDYGTTVARRALIACRINWITCNYPFSLDAQSAIWKLTKPNLGTGPGGTAIYNAAVAAVPSTNGTESQLEVYRKEPYTNFRQDIFVWQCPNSCTLSASIAGSNELCHGESTELVATASGGTANYSYQWKKGSNIIGTSSMVSVSPSVTTTYQLIVTDSDGCTTSVDYNVQVHSLPNASISATSSTCDAQTGSIQFSFSDNIYRTNISFSIDNGNSYPVTIADNTGSYNWNGLNAGTYQVWSRWGDGDCPISLGSVTVGSGSNLNVTIANNANICSAASQTLSTSVSGQANCANSCIRQVSDTQSCSPNYGAPWSLYFLESSSSARYMVEHSNSLKFIETGNTATLTGVVSDHNGTITINATFGGKSGNPSGTPKSNLCNSANDWNWTFYHSVSGTLTKSDGTVYTLSRRGPAIQMGTHANDHQLGLGLSGWYTASSGGSTYDGDFNIMLSSCVTQSSEVTYSWSTGATTQNLTVNQSGTYTVTVTDCNGCTATDEIVVIANGPPSPSISGETQLCNGESTNLSISTTGGTQPYTYTWNQELSNSTTHTVSPTNTTTYLVTVTDANGCTGTASHQIEVSPLPSLSLSTDSPCFVSGAMISSNASGGTPPYTYSTTGPNGFTANTPNVSVSAAGTYTMTLTDNKGCTSTSSIIIHPALNTQLTASADTVCIGEFSTISVTPTGLTYNWSTGASASTLFLLPLETKWYKVTTTDANGCTAVDSARIVVNAAAITNVTTASHLDCDGNCTGSINVTVSGNTNGNFKLQYTYNGTVYTKGPYVLTNPGQEEVFTINQLCAGQYSNIKIVGQETGCTSTWSSNVTITQTNADWEHVTHTSDVSNCNGACDGSFTIDANLGVTGNFNVSYVFNGNTVTLGPYNHAGDILIDNLCAGTYSNITITSVVSGCQDVWPTDIVIKEPKPTASIVTKEDDFCQLGAGSATIRVTSGATPYTIQWTSADGSHAGTETLTINGNKKLGGLIGGKNYCFNIKDANGCSP